MLSRERVDDVDIELGCEVFAPVERSREIHVHDRVAGVFFGLGWFAVDSEILERSIGAEVPMNVALGTFMVGADGEIFGERCSMPRIVEDRERNLARNDREQCGAERPIVERRKQENRDEADERESREGENRRIHDPTPAASVDERYPSTVKLRRSAPLACLDALHHVTPWARRPEFAKHEHNIPGRTRGVKDYCNGARLSRE